MKTTMTDELSNYADSAEVEESYRIRPQIRSLISRGSKPVRRDIQDPQTGEWRTVIRMSREKFDETAKGIFLEEFAKWGRMGEAASAAGVSTQTVRKHMEEDEDFAEALMIQEEDYRTKLISHHQNLLFNGVTKRRYDKEGNVVEETQEYPIRLIELELKKHDKGYRDKQQLEIEHKGGVLVTPAEVGTVDDWEKRFGAAKDVTPDAGDKLEITGD